MKQQDMPAITSEVLEVSSVEGLTKLEWMAGMALQGLLADPHRDANVEGYAIDSVTYAEAALAEIERRKEK